MGGNRIFACRRKPPCEGERCTAPAVGRALWLGEHPAPISQAAWAAHLLCSTSLGFFEYRHSCNIPPHAGSSRSPHQSCGCLALAGTGVTGSGGGGAGADPNKDGTEAKGDDVGAGSDKSEKHTHRDGARSCQHKTHTLIFGSYFAVGSLLFGSDGLVSPEDYIFCPRRRSYHTETRLLPMVKSIKLC